MNQVRNREVHEHRPEQAEERQAHAETFILLLQEFVTHQEYREHQHQDKGGKRPAALEIAHDKRTIHATEAKLHHPRKARLPRIAPFAVKEAVVYDNCILRDRCRLVTYLAGKLLGPCRRSIGCIFDFRCRSIGNVLNFRRNSSCCRFCQVRHLARNRRKSRRRRKRRRLFSRFSSLDIICSSAHCSHRARRRLRRLHRSHRLRGHQAIFRPAFRMFQVSRKQQH